MRIKTVKCPVVGCESENIEQYCTETLLGYSDGCVNENRINIVGKCNNCRTYFRFVGKFNKSDKYRIEDFEQMSRVAKQKKIGGNFYEAPIHIPAESGCAKEKIPNPENFNLQLCKECAMLRICMSIDKCIENEARLLTRDVLKGAEFDENEID